MKILPHLPGLSRIPVIDLTEDISQTAVIGLLTGAVHGAVFAAGLKKGSQRDYSGRDAAGSE